MVVTTSLKVFSKISDNHRRRKRWADISHSLNSKWFRLFRVGGFIAASFPKAVGTSSGRRVFNNTASVRLPRISVSSANYFRVSPNRPTSSFNLSRMRKYGVDGLACSLAGDPLLFKFCPADHPVRMICFFDY